MFPIMVIAIGIAVLDFGKRLAVLASILGGFLGTLFVIALAGVKFDHEEIKSCPNAL